MAILKTAADCLLTAGFSLGSYTLGEGEYVRFRCSMATLCGSIYEADEKLYSDKTDGGDYDHVSLSLDLRGLSIAPGSYRWELSLVLPSGAEIMLLPGKYNLLTVEERDYNE